MKIVKLPSGEFQISCTSDELFELSCMVGYGYDQLFDSKDPDNQIRENIKDLINEASEGN